MLEAEAVGDVDELDRLTAERHDIDEADPVDAVLAQVEGLLHGRHRQSPGEPTGADHEKMDGF